MADDKLFELVTKMYTEMQTEFKEIKSDIKDLKAGQLLLENRLDDTRKTLFDGYIQHQEQLTRIEERLEEHDVILLKKSQVKTK